MYVMEREEGKHGPVLKKGDATNKEGIFRYINCGLTKKYKNIDYPKPMIEDIGGEFKKTLKLYARR